LAEPTRSEGVVQREKPKPKKKASGLADALNPNIPRERRVGTKGQTMEEVVAEAVKGAKPDRE
jgi:hypothetical protein